ncbi:hypothetical protein BFW88_14615 [Pseudomonas fluorescens]|nr:hypothetical protein BFW88_14615 [Pseudomonas fluorescens]OPB09456.1 hypothetical protein BFW92_14805 [Pseudomonas fluorescens]OPB21301.1 hypothetical protein BFW93_14590 [Pseudomonas fluorescens]
MSSCKAPESTTWTTRKSARAKMKQTAATAPSTCRVICLRSNRQTRQFLSSIRKAQSSRKTPGF